MTTGLTSVKPLSSRLNCIESEKLTGVIIPCATGRQVNIDILQYSHGTNFSDGDIYRKVRQYHKENNDSAAERWIQQLSRCKQVGLKCLLENRGIVNAFDTLLNFPGLWIGLELGNIRRILAMHCDEEIIRYLEHIRVTWSHITLQKTSLEGAVDVETVRSLQLRAPAVSILDQDFIGTAVDSGLIFSKVIDPEIRTAISDAIKKIPCIIPSIKTLHENSKLLGIGAKVLKDLVVGKPLRASTYKTLFSHWKAPKDTVVEVTEREFRHNKASNGDIFWNLVYKQIWISALRGFPELIGLPPRKEKCGDTPNAEINVCRQYQFLLLVNRLGIETSKTRTQLENNPRREALGHCITQIFSPQCPSPKLREDMLDHMQQALPCNGELRDVSPVCSEFSYSSESLERRWGRPFQNSHIAIQNQFYLPNLTSTMLPKFTSRPTALFVKKDFLDAFFGPTSALVLSTADALPSWSNPVSSTIEIEDDSYSGMGGAADEVDRMSIELPEHEDTSKAEHASSMPNLSAGSEHVPGGNPFENSVNFESGHQNEAPNYNFPQSETQKLPTMNHDPIEQPRSPIVQHLESSLSSENTPFSNLVPDFESKSQLSVEDRSDQLPGSFAGGPDHPRSPITLDNYPTASNISATTVLKSSRLPDNDEPHGPFAVQSDQTQLPLGQSRRYRRSPIALVNKDIVMGEAARLGQSGLVGATLNHESPQEWTSKPSIATLSRAKGGFVGTEKLDEPELSKIRRGSKPISQGSNNIEMQATPISQVIPPRDVLDTAAFNLRFDRPVLIPETSVSNVTYDKDVDMTDIFCTAKGTSDAPHHFTSGKQSSKSLFQFYFYNGMGLNSVALAKNELEKYLKKRPASVMLVLSGNGSSTSSSKAQVWRSIPRRHIVAQMAVEPSLTYVLSVPDKAAWWISNGSRVLQKRKIHPLRKKRYENKNTAQTDESDIAVLNPPIHNHYSDSLNIISEIFYNNVTDMQTCEIDLANRQLELPSATSLLKYKEAKSCTLITFDRTCLDQPCFQKYFRGYNSTYEETKPAYNALNGANSKRIVWMVNSGTALNFKEERYPESRAKLAKNTEVTPLDVGGPLAGENNLFEEESEGEEFLVPQMHHTEQSADKNDDPMNDCHEADLSQVGHEEAKPAKRGVEEMEERSRTMLLSMPSRIKEQEPKRHKGDSHWVDITRTKTPPLDEEKLYEWVVIEW